MRSSWGKSNNNNNKKNKANEWNSIHQWMLPSRAPPNFQQHEAFNNLMEEPGQLTINGGEVVTVEWDDLGEFSKCQRMAQRTYIDFLHVPVLIDAGRVVWDVLYGMSGMCHGAFVGWTSKTLAATLSMIWTFAVAPPWRGGGGKASSLLPEKGWWMGVSRNGKTIPKEIFD